MRILFLALDIDLVGMTGDSIHVRELAASLSNVGNKVALVGYIPPESRDDVSDLFEGTEISLHTPEGRGNLSTLRFSSLVVKKFNPDVIYERRFSAKMGATLSVMHRLPLVVEVNGLVDEELEILGETERVRKISGKTRTALRKRFFSRAKRIVVVTDGIKRGLHERYGIPLEKMVVVHNGANTDLFRPMDKGVCREKLGLDKEVPYLLFVGNLIPWQGIDDTIRAVPKILKSVPQVRLLIVGDGPQRDELESLAGSLDLSEVVHFTGNVPYNTVPVYMGASDVCLAPKKALDSGFSPLKLYEYLACARPVIASRVEGFEILEQGAGLMFEPGNIEEFSDKTVTLLSDEGMMNSMGLEGRKIAEKEYSWEAVARRVTEVLKEAPS